IHETHERLVDQCRALDRVIRALAAQMPLREVAQLLIDEGGQLPERLLIAAAPLHQQLRYRSITAIAHARPLGSLEKIACGDFFDTAPAFPSAKSAVFAACLAA